MYAIMAGHNGSGAMNKGNVRLHQTKESPILHVTCGLSKLHCVQSISSDIEIVYL